jgi:hypothetical protein
LNFYTLQLYFYIKLDSDMKKIKKDDFRDMWEKLKLWKHMLKKKLNIRTSDTPDTVRARARMIIQGYDSDDMSKLLGIWCDEGNQV